MTNVLINFTQNVYTKQTRTYTKNIKKQSRETLNLGSTMRNTENTKPGDCFKVTLFQAIQWERTVSDLRLKDCIINHFIHPQ